MRIGPWFSGVFGGAFRSATRRQWAPTLTSHDPNPPLPLETASSGAQNITGVQVSHAFAVLAGVVVAGAITIASATAPGATFGVTEGKVNQTLVGQSVSHQFSVTPGAAHRTIPGVEAFHWLAAPTGNISSPVTIAGVPVSHQFVVDVGTVVTGGGPQTITGVPVSHQFAAGGGTIQSPVTVAGTPVSHQFAVQGGTVSSPVTVPGQATGHTWVVDVGTVIQSGGLQTIDGVPVEFGFVAPAGSVVQQSFSTETQPLGGGSGGRDDRLLVQRRVTDLRSRQVSFKGSGGVRVHGTARVDSRAGDLEVPPFNPIRIPAIPVFKPTPAPPPHQTISSSSAPSFVLPRTRTHIGRGGVRVKGSAPMYAARLQWASRGGDSIPPRRQVVVGLGGVLVSGAATVTPVSWHKALLRDDDDVIQLLIEADAI